MAEIFFFWHDSARFGTIYRDSPRIPAIRHAAVVNDGIAGGIGFRPAASEQDRCPATALYVKERALARREYDTELCLCKSFCLVIQGRE
ncbi:MAG: hypothetical protein ABSH38_07040 [Verrucomicrobiota bacterium]